MIDSIDVDSCGHADPPANSFAYSLSMVQLQGYDPTRSKEIIEDILMEAINVFQQVRKHD